MNSIIAAPKTALFYLGLGLVLASVRVLRRCTWCGAALMHVGTWLVCWTRVEDGDEA